MACESSEAVQGDVPLLLSEDDFMNFSETTDNLQKTLDAISDVIQCRAKIFMQKKEKHQQVLHSQMMKLDNERKEYVKKAESVMNDMGEAKSQLMQIEHSYFNMRNKLMSEKQTNKTLEEQISVLQLENKQKNVQFYKTSELFTKVISWYKNHLHMGINLDKGNPDIITVTFKESKKDFEGYPNVTLKMLNGNQFQVLNLHPLLEEYNKTLKQILQPHEVTLFLNQFRKCFLESS